MNLSLKEQQALREIRNHLIHLGKFPSVRELMSALSYKSPRSAALLVESLTQKDFLKRKSDGKLILNWKSDSNEINAQTVRVPLVGYVACGQPILAEENIEAMIPIDTNVAHPPHKYFLLKAKGDSMDSAGINDGDLILVRQQTHAENGQTVVALIDGEVTVKEFCRNNGLIILKPRSANKSHHPVILKENFLIQGVVITAIPQFYRNEHE